MDGPAPRAFVPDYRAQPILVVDGRPGASVGSLAVRRFACTGRVIASPPADKNRRRFAPPPQAPNWLRFFDLLVSSHVNDAGRDRFDSPGRSANSSACRFT